MPPASPDIARDPHGRTAEQRQARIDALLTRIEDEDLVSGWAWPALAETLGRLAALGEDLSWLLIAYLSSVVIQRDRMFHSSAVTEPLEGMGTTRPPMVCRCGTEFPTPTPQRRAGRFVTIARCPACGIDLAMYDEVPYEKPTLITAALG